jgi:hypothetical protein
MKPQDFYRLGWINQRILSRDRITQKHKLQTKLYRPGLQFGNQTISG